MTSRHLIINADDFGICTQTNKAIKELFAAGLITSTSLIAVGEAADEAAELSAELNMPVGAHLALNSDFKDMPWRALTGGKSISESGMLFWDTKRLAREAQSRDVTEECRAQIEYILSFGVTLDHIDNHSGTMYGINGRLFFLNAFRLSRRYGMPFRFPRRGGFLKGYFRGGVPSAVKLAHKAIAFTAGAMGVRLPADIITNPYPIAEIASYRALEEYYLKAVTEIGSGVSELFLHPSYDNAEFSAITPEWEKRQYELELLFSGRLSRRLADEGIEAVSYRALSKKL